MSKHEAALGIANHLLKTSNDQMVKGLARGLIEAVAQIKEMQQGVDDQVALNAELVQIINLQNAAKELPNDYPMKQCKEVNFDYVLDDERKVNVDAEVEYSNYNRYTERDRYPYDIGDVDLSIWYYHDKDDCDGLQLFKKDISESDWTKLLAKAEDQVVSDYFLNRDELPYVETVSD